MIFRTEEQKKNQEASWARGDRAFFAAGACHILVSVFLHCPEGNGFRPLEIVPKDDFRGSHVVAVRDDLVFDYHGVAFAARYWEHHFRKMRRFFPGWDAHLEEVPDFMTDSYFRRRNCRAPHQFYQDPIKRAEKMVLRLVRRSSVSL